MEKLVYNRYKGVITLYQITSRVRFSEIGEDGYLTLHHLLNYFQDCSTFHLEDCGLGLDYFMSQNLAFYLLSWQIEINRLPVLGECIRVGTMIYDCKGMFGYRNYVLYDEHDNILAYANVSGCFLNPFTNEFVKLSPDEIAKYPIEEKLDMEYLPRKIKAPKAKQQMAPIRINQFQIDMNGHVNNSQYVAIASEYLPPKVQVKQIRVDYKQAAKLGDIIIPTVARQDDIYYVMLCNQELKPYVIVAFRI